MSSKFKFPISGTQNIRKKPNKESAALFTNAGDSDQYKVIKYHFSFKEMPNWKFSTRNKNHETIPSNASSCNCTLTLTLGLGQDFLGNQSGLLETDTLICYRHDISEKTRNVFAFCCINVVDSVFSEIQEQMARYRDHIKELFWAGCFSRLQSLL